MNRTRRCESDAGKRLSRIHAAEVCDATGDAQRTERW